MIHSSKFVAVLDACVLYPAPIRDLLLHLAHFELYTPKWTAHIQDEWTRNLLLNRKDLSPVQLGKTTAAMQAAYPDADVHHYEPLMDALKLPDPNDRHVLAAAIRCKADVIVTANLKDFPSAVLTPFGIEAQHPDTFIANLVDLSPQRAFQAFLQQVSFLRNPPRSPEQVLDNLRRLGLSTAADKMIELL